MVDWGMGVANARGSFDAGNEYVERLYNMQAQKAAGAKIVSGDLRGAAGDLAGRGDVSGALNLTDRAAAGDAAKTTQAQSDADKKAAQFKQQHDYLQRAVPVLTGILQKAGPQELLKAFDQIGGELQQLGIPPDMIGQYRQAFERDPQGTLQTLAATAQRKFTFQKVGDDVVVLDEADPTRPVAEFKAPPKGPSLADQSRDANNPFNADGTPNQAYQEYDANRTRQSAEDRRSVIVNNPLPQNPTNTLRPSIQLRKEFDQQPDVKAFNDVANSYEIINDIATRANAAEKAGGQPSAADDMSMIFAYMKMLDPGSVVREGEFANAQNTAGIPDQVRNAYNRALNGNRLNQKQRTDFAATAKGVYQSRKKRYEQLVQQYQGYALDSGLDDTVIQPRIDAGAPAPQANVIDFNSLPD